MTETDSVASIVGWLATGGLIAWITALLTLRKDDRAVVIDNITKERKEWRIYLRKWCAEVSNLVVKEKWNLDNFLRLRAELITRLNPNDKNDIELISTFDQLRYLDNLKSNEDKCKIIIDIQHKIGCLLKQDWENVKVEVMPFYVPMFSIKKSKRKYIVENKFNLKLEKPYIKEIKFDLKDPWYVYRVNLIYFLTVCILATIGIVGVLENISYFFYIPIILIIGLLIYESFFQNFNDK